MEHYEVKNYRGDYIVSEDRIARVAAEDAMDFLKIKVACATNAAVRMTYLCEAKVIAITVEEQQAHLGIPLRRCPCCLVATAARMCYCGFCNAEFMSMEPAMGTPTKRTQEFPKTPKSASSSAARASSAPAYAPAADVKLDLPQVQGVKWKTKSYKGYEWVVPEKRSMPIGGTSSSAVDNLAYCGDRVGGNFVTLNGIFYSCLSNRIMTHIDVGRLTNSARRRS